jgi:ATP-dependent RNA helicase SUPV3L1/SUV3
LPHAPSPTPDARALAANGLRLVGRHVAPVEMLERLDALLREGQQARRGGADRRRRATALGWTPAEAAAVLRALDYTPALRPKEGDPILWKRRGAQRPEPKVTARPDSPFAALAKLTEPPLRRKKPRRRKADVWLWRARFFKTRSLAGRFVPAS